MSGEEHSRRREQKEGLERYVAGPGHLSVPACSELTSFTLMSACSSRLLLINRAAAPLNTYSANMC